MHEEPQSLHTGQPVRIEDVLADRIEAAPVPTQQISPTVLIVFGLGIIALGVLIGISLSKPDVYAVAEHKQIHSAPHSADAEEQRRLAELTEVIDTLEKHIAANPNDLEAKITLANAYYDTEQWAKALPLYKEYLGTYPKNTNARVDYAFVIAQTHGDYFASLAEIETALRYEPDHFNALFNGGLIALRAYENDRAKGFMTAGTYFKRAQQIAQKNNNPQAVAQIQQILDEMKKVVEESEDPYKK